MPKIHETDKGAVVTINQAPHMVEQIDISTPSARGANTLYRIRFRNLITRQKYDGTYKGDDQLPSADFEKRDVQLSYTQDDRLIFMDMTDFSELVIDRDAIQEEAQYITEEMEGIRALICEGRALGLELPPTANLAIVQCDPSIRGASATARTKPATLSTGLVVQVPEYISSGERIRVDTRTGRFLGRA